MTPDQEGSYLLDLVSTIGYDCIGIEDEYPQAITHAIHSRLEYLQKQGFKYID